jgi:ribosomal protein L35AE/L33A
MNRLPLAVTLTLAAALLAVATPAAAVIGIDVTVAKVYQGSKIVVIGTVTDVNADSGVIDVKLDEPLKGKSLGERIRLKVVKPAELIKQVAVGQPMVLLITTPTGSGSEAVHLADTPLLTSAIAGSNMQTWQIKGVHEAMPRTFPGRTAALVRLLADLKAGKNTILDKWDQTPYSGPMRKLADLKVQKPRWLMAADVNGDGKPDLLVGAANGTRLLLATAGGYYDATEKWGAWGAAGAYRAAGDVNNDGKLDLLLDDTLWINDGQKFAAKARFALPEKVRPLAAALLDATGDKRPDALFLAANGELRVFENPGAADKPWSPRPPVNLWKETDAPVAAFFGDWGDSGKPHVMVAWETRIVRYALDPADGPPADLDRLTGTPLSKSVRFRGGIKGILPIAVDVNGDRKPELFAVCDAGALMLVNRGFGTYMLDDKLAAPGGQQPPLKLTAATIWTAAAMHAAGRDDLLILAADGTLYEVRNEK